MAKTQTAILRAAFLTVTRKVNDFVTGRASLVKELEGIVSEAQGMITQLAGENPFPRKRAKTRVARTAKKAGRPKGTKMSAAARAKMSKAAKKRWAEKKKAKD